MAGPRRQLGAPLQGELFKSRGGKRAGAGRPPKSKRAGSPHKRRPTLKGRYPVHVVLRVVTEMKNLRRRDMYKALRAASVVAAKNPEKFRIIHVSIQNNHVHLIVEAESRMALARGMQSFQISAAKLMNATISVREKRIVRRRGQVFADRYHAEIITSPKQARHTLSYVLNNWRKHKQDELWSAQAWAFDPFSTGIQFPHWSERVDRTFVWSDGELYDPLVVYAPRTWLLSEGWKRHGLINTHEVPSTPKPRAVKRPLATAS
ncbi:MAG: transposase [Kofleriaceae bacterium]